LLLLDYSIFCACCTQSSTGTLSLAAVIGYGYQFVVEKSIRKAASFKNTELSFNKNPR